MATTYLVRGMDLVKGPYSGSPVANPAHVIRATLNVSGTYVTNGAQFDLCKLFTGNRMGVSSIVVKSVVAFGDYNDGTNALTVSNADVTFASGGSLTSISAASTNNLVTLELWTGETNGAGSGAELTNTTAVAGDFGILMVCELSF